MGDSKVSRAELADFARQTAAFLEPLQRDVHGLKVVIDCIVETLGIGDKVKAELARRKAEAMKAKDAAPKSGP